MAVEAGFFGDDGSGLFHLFENGVGGRGNNQNIAGVELCLDVCSDLQMQTFPTPTSPPTPTPERREEPTRCALIILVVPEMPTGTPAVMTAMSPLLEITGLLRQIGRGLDQLVGGVDNRHNQRDNAPGEAQMPVGLLICDAGDDRGGGPVFAEQTGGAAAL